MKFTAFEIASAKGYFVGISLDNDELSNVFDKTMRALGKEVDTYSSGNLNAGSEFEAMEKIRKGDWQYSQKI